MSQSSYEDYHRQILQYFLHDGAYNEQELTDLLTAIRERYEIKIKVQDEIRTFVDVYLPLINKQINEYGIEIKQVASEEYENQIYFVCTQNFKAQFVKMDCSYTEKEAACFEKLLELIITSDEKCITPREVFEALLANDLKLTQKEFGEVMTRFHRDKWIESGPNNTVILHARAILEMQSFIIDTYRDDVYNCQICTRLLVRGLACSNSSCNVHMHRACAARYFLRINRAGTTSATTASSQSKKTQYTCPSCKQEWRKKDVDSVLRDSVGASNDENGVQALTGTRNKKQRTSRATTASRTTRTSHRMAMDQDEN